MEPTTPTASPQRTNLLNFSSPQMETWFAETLGEKPFRARQIFRWIYKKKTLDLDAMTDLSLSLRSKLNEVAEIRPLEVEQIQNSVDGTRKILFRLQDGARIESVLIPEAKRMTLCISSQVGCALGCRFCYTATMGPGRNLSVAEYMGQFLASAATLEEGRSITNVVFMGMGEPLVNFENLLTTLSILTDKRGLNLGARRLTVSTAGLCPQILKLSERMNIRLAISLHATTDEQRDELMPINQRYNLATLFSALQQFQANQQSRRLPITLEYTLIQKVNDSDEDAHRLVKLASQIDSKINLIPYNEYPGAPYKRPSNNRIHRFHNILQDANVRVTRRATRGDDISAACGQLAIEAPLPQVGPAPGSRGGFRFPVPSKPTPS